MWPPPQGVPPRCNGNGKLSISSAGFSLEQQNELKNKPKKRALARGQPPRAPSPQNTTTGRRTTRLVLNIPNDLNSREGQRALSPTKPWLQGSTQSAIQNPRQRTLNSRKKQQRGTRPRETGASPRHRGHRGARPRRGRRPRRGSARRPKAETADIIVPIHERTLNS